MSTFKRKKQIGVSISTSMVSHLLKPNIAVTEIGEKQIVLKCLCFNSTDCASTDYLLQRKTKTFKISTRKSAM